MTLNAHICCAAFLVISTAIPKVAHSQTVAAKAEALPYPTHKVLNTFSRSCSRIEDYVGTRSAVVAEGWELFEPPEKSQLGLIISASKKLIAAQQNPALRHKITAFRKLIGGRQLFLAVSETRDDSLTNNDCLLYDFGANAPLTAQTVVEWSGRKPTKLAVDGAPDVIYYIWKPGLKPDHSETLYSYTPRGSLDDVGLSNVRLSGHTFVSRAEIPTSEQ